MKNGLICSFFLSMLAGCQPQVDKPNIPNDVVAPKGTAQQIAGGVHVTASNFSFDVPKGWKTIDMTSKGLESALAEVAKDPKSAAVVPQVRQMAASGAYKVFVFGPTTNGFGQNINVIQLDQPRDVTVDDIREADKKELASVSDSPASFDTIKLPAGDTLHYVAELRMKTAKGDGITAIGYAIPRGKSVTTITFTCLSKDAKDMDKVASSAMNSFEFKS